MRNTGQFIASAIATMPFIFVVCDTKAAPILDQHHNPTITTLAEADEIVDHAQTFTVGIVGVLTSVDILLCRGINTTQDLLFDVRNTATGVPVESDELSNNAVLASVSVPSSAVKINQFSFINVDISSFNVLVTPGEVLALVLRPSEPFVIGNDDGYGWGGSLEGNQYAGGTRYSRITSFDIPWQSFEARDMGFATYIGGPGVPISLVTPPVTHSFKPAPEPGGFELMCIGIAALLTQYKRIQRFKREA